MSGDLGDKEKKIETKLKKLKKLKFTIECMNERLVQSFPVPVITNQNLRRKST